MGMLLKKRTTSQHIRSEYNIKRSTLFRNSAQVKYQHPAACGHDRFNSLKKYV